MDGVIVDNGHYHKLAWKAFSDKYGIPFSDEKFRTVFFGRTNQEILPVLFQKELSLEELEKLASEKEIIYREVYKPHIVPIAGLVPFMRELKNNKHKIAIATSAPKENVDFVVEALQIDQFIDVVVDDSMVSKGKPHPEIYIKASELLSSSPKNCVVFEDSLSGTKSAFDAVTNVVGLTTTIPEDEHKYTHHIVTDFTEVSIEQLASMFFY